MIETWEDYQLLQWALNHWDELYSREQIEEMDADYWINIQKSNPETTDF